MDASTKAINYASIIIGSIIGAGVGWYIYQKVTARAIELEEEELENGLQSGALVVGGDASYTDMDRNEDAAALMDPDDISLWDQDERERGEGYSDQFTDDEDVFAAGDLDEDAAKPKR